MPLNIEFKARVKDLKVLLQQLVALRRDAPEVLDQEDTFFLVPRGHLKMRCDPFGQCHLIYYRRDRSPGPKLSAYFIERVASPAEKRAELSRLFGQGSVVQKRRLLYHIEGARVHVDEVEGLGSFVEVEIPVASIEVSHRAMVKAKRLMKLLRVSAADLESEPYVHVGPRTT